MFKSFSSSFFRFRFQFITKAILVVSFVSLCTDISSEMLYPVMPLYLKSIGFSIFYIGILEGIAEAAAGLSKGYFGNLSDKFQKRTPFIQFGYFLSAFSKPVLVFFINPVWVFFARMMDKLGKGVRTGARDALLSSESTVANKGKVFGFHRAMDTLGAAIGPVIALIYLYFYPQNYIVLFYFAFIPGILAVVLTLLIKDKPVANLEVVPRQNVSFFSYLTYWKKSPQSFRYLVIGLLAFTLFNSSDMFLLLYIKKQGFSDTMMISFYIFYNLAYALLSYPVGYLADKIGLKKILTLGLLCFSIVYVFFPFATNLYMYVVLFLIYGLFSASTEGVSKALISNIADKSQTATAIGFYTSFVSVSSLIASSLAGFIWFKFGAFYVFFISGCFVFTVFLYFNFIFSSKRFIHMQFSSK